MDALSLICGGAAGYVYGKKQGTVTPNTDDDASIAQLRAALSVKEDELVSLRAQLAAADATSSNTIATLSARINTLEKQIAALQTQIANAGGGISFSRSAVYNGGVESGITNSGGAITLASATMVAVPITAGIVSYNANTASADYGYLGAPASPVNLRTVSEPTLPARPFTISQEKLLLFTGTSTARALKMSFLVVEFDPQTDVAKFKSNYTTTACGVVFWIRKNVCCFLVTPDSNGLFACGLLLPPAAPVLIVDGFFDTNTISSAFTPHEIIIKRASLIHMTDEYVRADVDLPDAIISADGGTYVRLDHGSMPVFADPTHIPGLREKTRPIHCHLNRPTNILDQVQHNTFELSLNCISGLILS